MTLSEVAMVDKLRPEERSRVMASVRSVNTKPEIFVRSLLHRMGFRFRMHRRDLPGCPDICLPKYGSVIFVHGCFWHGHGCPRGTLLPKTNADFWATKLAGNVARDARQLSQLSMQGWRVLVIWECELRNDERASAQVRRFLEG